MNGYSYAIAVYDGLHVHRVSERFLGTNVQVCGLIACNTNQKNTCGYVNLYAAGDLYRFDAIDLIATTQINDQTLMVNTLDKSLKPLNSTQFQFKM